MPPPRPPRPTHFLCIPLVTKGAASPSRRQLSASLAAFAADVTQTTTTTTSSPAPAAAADSGGFAATTTVVPEQAIRPVGTLHLTLGVMSFPRGDGGEGLDRAVALLRSLAPRQRLANAAAAAAAAAASASGAPGPSHLQALAAATTTSTTTGGAAAAAAAAGTKEGSPPSPSPLSVTLRGLHSMQEPARTRVLYASPVEDGTGTCPQGTLVRFCESLRARFLNGGLMMSDEGSISSSRPLLLHATIANTIYVRGWRRRGGGQRLEIDARGILERYADFVWMRDPRRHSKGIMSSSDEKRMAPSQAARSSAGIVIAPPPRAQLTRAAADKDAPAHHHHHEPAKPNKQEVSGDGSSRSSSSNSKNNNNSGSKGAAKEQAATMAHNHVDVDELNQFTAQYNNVDRIQQMFHPAATSALIKKKDERIAELERELAAATEERKWARFREQEREAGLGRGLGLGRLGGASASKSSESEAAAGRKWQQQALQQPQQLRERDDDDEVRALRATVAGLKQWISAASTRQSLLGGQVVAAASDDEVGEAAARLRHGLQNWVVSHFRRSSFRDLPRADPAILDELSELVPMYQELAVSHTKAHLLQCIVSSILQDMVFDVYFVGLPNEQAVQLGQVHKYLESMTASSEAINQWRAMTLAILSREASVKLQEETDAVTEKVMSTVNRILDAITDAEASDARDQALRALVSSSIGLARLLVVQQAVFKVYMPKLFPHQQVLFDATTMDDVGEEDEDSLAAREICCVTFPGIIKTGDENGSHPQYRNVIAKARVLCSPE
ncbi:RNA ligase-like domain-containing protein [Xylariaceae sp. FL0804]|nr:RNA ligase-like domain-containing protein [Xylariaceae sp. FL0804]